MSHHFNASKWYLWCLWLIEAIVLWIVVDYRRRFWWFEFDLWWCSTTALRLAVSRIKLLKNKREGHVGKLKRQVVLLLHRGHKLCARLPVITIIFSIHFSLTFILNAIFSFSFFFQFILLLMLKCSQNWILVFIHMIYLHLCMILFF